MNPDTSQISHFRDAKAIGFDLDHTLAVYVDGLVNGWAYQESVAYLVERAGYPRELAHTEPKWRAQRGLFLDTDAGHVVAADANFNPLAATSGFEIVRRFADEPTETTPASLSSDRWHVINTPFDLPTAELFQVIGAIAPTRPSNKAVLDIRQWLDHAHRRGSLKQRVTTSISDVIRPKPELRHQLDELARRYRLFVVTNSEPDYATQVLNHLLGGGWQPLFDVLVTDSQKPSFFEPGATKPGYLDVERALGVSGPHVVFVGDSVPADLIPAKAVGWRTVGVVPELEHPAHPVYGPAVASGPPPTLMLSAFSAASDALTTSVGAWLQTLLEAA